MARVLQVLIGVKKINSSDRNCYNLKFVILTEWAKVLLTPN